MVARTWKGPKAAQCNADTLENISRGRWTALRHRNKDSKMRYKFVGGCISCTASRYPSQLWWREAPEKYILKLFRPRNLLNLSARNTGASKFTGLVWLCISQLLFFLLLSPTWIFLIQFVSFPWVEEQPDRILQRQKATNCPGLIRKNWNCAARSCNVVFVFLSHQSGAAVFANNVIKAQPPQRLKSSVNLLLGD